MAEAFTFQANTFQQDPGKSPTRRKVLVTGAAGTIGRYFAEHSSDIYDLRLMVRKEEDIEQLSAFGEVVLAQLTDLQQLKEVCQGIDTVVHLAANPDSEATWSQLLEPNIIGTYNIYVAAKSAGCRRVIFASSIHAVSGYPKGVQVKINDPVNPGDLYGVTKCFGEALGRYMAEQEGLSVIAIRIGAFQPVERMRAEWSTRVMDAFVSQRDLLQLIHKAIEAEHLKFAILHGLSASLYNKMDISETCELVGYEPQDDITTLNPKLAPLDLVKSLSTHSRASGIASGLREDL